MPSSKTAPVGPKNGAYAGVAQLVEQLICNQQVAGSSPIASSKKAGSMTAWKIEEGCPSGQWGRAVNPLTQVFEGSNPSPSTTSFGRKSFSRLWRECRFWLLGGSSSVGRALAFQAKGRGFESRFPLQNAQVAQSVEHVLGKDEVTGSNPVLGSSKLACRTNLYIVFKL